MRNETRQLKGGNYKVTAINISKDILELYRKKSVAYNISISKLANIALQEYAKKHFMK